jgi:chromosome partitioning protein
MARTITICSQKGGVGKTSTAINLGAFLNHARFRTLIIDLDPQANATSGVSGSLAKTSPIGRALKDPQVLPELAQSTCESYLSLIPDVKSRNPLPDDVRPEQAAPLRDVLADSEYDFVLVDCPPGLGPATQFALSLANSVLLPVQAEYFSLESLTQLLPEIELAARAGGGIEVEGLLLTMFSEENDLSHQVAAELEKHFPNETFRTIIPRDVTIAEAASRGLPICEYDLRSRGAWAYLSLAKEIIRNVGKSEKTRPRAGRPDPPQRRRGIRRRP